MQGVNVKACGCIQACSDSCRSTRYQRRKRERSLKQTTRTHEHMLTNTDIVSVPVIATKSGVYCAICGFSPSTYAVNYAVTTMQSLGIV